MIGHADEVEAIFTAAIALPTSRQRSEYADQACGSNAVLRNRVEELLTAHFGAGDFLEQPPTAVFRPESDDLTECAGSTIGPYKLLQQIGEGGMGVVFMAEQAMPIRRHVALKIIKPGMDSRRVIARFEAERQALALMDHPNIAKVLDAGASSSGRPYFVMELVRGVPITEYCDAQRLGIRARLELMVAVCHGVQHAHQKGVIHRDLKPTNVLVAEYDGRAVPRIIDFGVAKAIGQQLAEKTLFTQFGQIIGTLEYMSPEQARFNQLDVDTRSDVYSLGVLIYELLAGSTPLEKERLRTAAFDQILHMISDEEPPCPSARLGSSDSLPAIAAHRGLEPRKLAGLLRGDLDWIVMRALEKERNRRYETASGLAHDLEHYLADEPVAARPPSTWYRLQKTIRRNKGAFAAGVSLATALLVGLTLSTWLFLKEREARRLAVAQESRANQAAEMSAKAVGLLAEMLAGVGEPTVESTLLLEEVLSKAAVHPSAAQSLNNLGEALRERGRYAQAEILHRRAQAILTSLASEDHRFFIYSLNNLALSLWNQGKAEEAEQMMRRALATGTDLWGTDDWQIAMLYSNLGSMIQERELYEDSEDLLQRALKIRRRDLGDNHDNTAETMFHLAELSVRQGHLEEAERRYREAEAMLRGAHAGNDGHLAATLMRLATTLMSAERFEEAEQYARESLKINENYQPEYWGTYCVRSVLGAALMGQQKLDKALPLLLDGHVGMQQRWGLIPFFDRFLVRNSIERLVKYCETVGDGESLAHWQAELNSFDAVASQPTGALPDHSRSASRLR